MFRRRIHSARARAHAYREYTPRFYRVGALVRWRLEGSDALIPNRTFSPDRMITVNRAVSGSC